MTLPSSNAGFIGPVVARDGACKPGFLLAPNRTGIFRQDPVLFWELSMSGEPRAGRLPVSRTMLLVQDCN